MLRGRHLIQPDDLTVSEIEEICSLAEQIIVDPESFNEVCRGKILATHHLHVHLVPKYKDGFEWGGVFQMNPHALELDEAGYDELIRMIREKL